MAVPVAFWVTSHFDGLAHIPVGCSGPLDHMLQGSSPQVDLKEWFPTGHQGRVGTPVALLLAI